MLKSHQKIWSTMKIAILSHAAMSVFYFRKALIKALIRQGHEVFIVVPRDEFAAKIKALGAQCVFYELNRASVNPFVVLKNFLNLRKIIKNLRPDLLQTAAHKSNTLGIIAAKSVGVKHCVGLVEGLGSFFVEDDLKSKMVRFGIKFLYKIAFKCADKFIFVSEANAEFARNLGLCENKICVIKSVGVNLRHFCPVKITREARENFLKSVNLKVNLPVVLMVARALWHKGVGEFYAAAKILQNEANFIFVGGTDANKSSVPISFLNGGKVCYLGHREDIAWLLNLCDIFALPSYKEGFPVSVLEAKACAKPCVISEVEGNDEALRHGLDGLFCNARDSADLAAQISLLLHDKKLRENLGQNAFKDALNYDENAIAAKYLKIYGEVGG